MSKKGKPRVAGSVRGRELRAAAALARFETVKEEPKEVTIKKEETSDSETEDEHVDQANAALDVDGSKLLDDKGRALVKICEDEDDQDDNARREMDEIQGVAPQQKLSVVRKSASNASQSHPDATKQESKLNKPASNTTSLSSAQLIHLDEIWKRRSETPAKLAAAKHTASAGAKPVSCNVCSLSNEPRSLTCAVCSNVLSPHLVPDHWRCNTGSCKQSSYINAGDSGACGVCGQVKLL